MPWPRAWQQDQIGPIADILPAFHQHRRALGLADRRAEAVGAAILRLEHVPRRLRLEKQAALAAPGPPHQQQEIGEVGRRGPKPRRRKFRAHAPAPQQRLPVAIMALHRIRLPLLRQRLSECAVLHAGRLEYEFLHKLREGGLGSVDHQRFGDLVTPAGIGKAAAGLGDHLDGRRVGRRDAVEDLDQIGQRHAGRVAHEARHADPRRHAEESAQGDWMVSDEAAFWDLPRGEFRVDVLVERKLVLIDHAHGADRRHEF
jgi:hypothetical protein